jgi:hypothetical protein
LQKGCKNAARSRILFLSLLLKELIPFIMFLSFSRILLSDQNVSKPMVAVHLPLNPNPDKPEEVPKMSKVN